MKGASDQQDDVVDHVSIAATTSLGKIQVENIAGPIPDEDIFICWLAYVAYVMKSRNVERGARE